MERISRSEGRIDLCSTSDNSIVFDCFLMGDGQTLFSWRGMSDGANGLN